MPTKRLPKNPPAETVYISAPQVCDRYGGRSHMWLERMLKRDPKFPRPKYFGRWRFFKIEELVAWERAAATAMGRGRPRKAEQAGVEA